MWVPAQLSCCDGLFGNSSYLHAGRGAKIRGGLATCFPTSVPLNMPFPPLLPGPAPMGPFISTFRNGLPSQLGVLSAHAQATHLCPNKSLSGR